jgi:hypothetical protein
MNLANYRKLLVAVLGAAIIAADQFFGFSAEWFQAENVMTVLVPILTAVGVWALPNTPPAA